MFGRRKKEQPAISMAKVSAASSFTAIVDVEDLMNYIADKHGIKPDIDKYHMRLEAMMDSDHQIESIKILFHTSQTTEVQHTEVLNMEGIKNVVNRL